MAKNKWFGTDGVRGVANIFPMNADFAFRLAAAASVLICDKQKKVAIARDTRISGDMLEAALCAGFLSSGIDVVSLGVVPTPAVTSLTPQLGVDMAVMITASHNPYHDNGIKLIAADGNKFSDEMTARLEALIEQNDFAFDPEKIGCKSCSDEVLNKYKQIALSTAKGSKPLQGLKIVLDCANGCFSAIMRELFSELGANVKAIACSPDGYNINRDCGSQHVENMLAEVRAFGADLGIAVDGDGDRIKVCDEKGELVRSEQLIAFLAQYLEQKGVNRGRPVVSTILSNTGLEKFVRGKLGLDYYSTPVGERPVVEKMSETGGAVGGEESGHIVLSDYSRSGDALMVSLVLAEGLKASGKKMSEIFPLFEFEHLFFENPRLNSREQVKPIALSAEVQSLLEECRRNLGDCGRAVIHPSGTEPLIRVWVCGSNAAKVDEAGRRLLALIEKLRDAQS